MIVPYMTHLSKPQLSASKWSFIVSYEVCTPFYSSTSRKCNDDSMESILPTEVLFTIAAYAERRCRNAVNKFWEGEGSDHFKPGTMIVNQRIISRDFVSSTFC
jgi:hypothetical protein